MIRVALIHEILSPYRKPLFEALAADPTLDFTVVHVARTEPRRDWAGGFEELSYPWRRVRAVALHHRRTQATVFVPYGLRRVLDELHADVVVVPGYGTPASLAALAWTVRRKRGLVMWTEGATHRSHAVVEHLKRAFTAACKSYVVPGEMAREHLGELGADPSAIHIAPNCIDLDLFKPAADRSFGVRSLICCAGLHPRKGLDVAVEGLHQADRTGKVKLVLVGGGPDHQQLERLAHRLRVPVAFTGSVQYGDVVHYLRGADAFLFPSRSDIWGFALQEAAATGLPLVSSVYAGATRELVVDGLTGWSVLPEVRSVATAIRRLLDLDPVEIHAMGSAARKAAERLSVDAAVAGFRAAVEQAIDRSSARQTP